MWCVVHHKILMEWILEGMVNIQVRGGIIDILRMEELRGTGGEIGHISRKGKACMHVW